MIHEVFATQIDEQHQRFFDNGVAASIRTINFVDDDDRFDTGLEGLRKHEPRLRHWTFCGIHQHKGAVSHSHNAFHLASEVRVARGVDQVDFDPFVFDGDVFGENRDTAFFFQVVAV